MNLYAYRKDSMTFVPVQRFYIVGALTMILLTGFAIRRPMMIVKNVEQEQGAYVLSDDLTNSFSIDALRKEMHRCGIRFIDIVIAQAQIETGNFKSRIFREANNLFGMKLARSRNTTAIGEFSGHALYEDWRQSVMDYSLYQSTYLRKIRTEDQYLEYLSQHYAEDPNYVNKIKQKI